MDLTSKEIRLFVIRKDLRHIFFWLGTRDEKTKKKEEEKREDDRSIHKATLLAIFFPFSAR